MEQTKPKAKHEQKRTETLQTTKKVQIYGSISLLYLSLIIILFIDSVSVTENNSVLKELVLFSSIKNKPNNNIITIDIKNIFLFFIIELVILIK